MQSVASEPKFRQTARTIVRLKLSSWRNVVFDFERKLTKHKTHYHTHQLANGSDNNKLKSKLEVSLIQISLCSHHPQHQHLARTKAVNCVYYLIVCAPHTLIYHHHRLPTYVCLANVSCRWPTNKLWYSTCQIKGKLLNC